MLITVEIGRATADNPGDIGSTRIARRSTIPRIYLSPGLVEGRGMAGLFQRK
jgi:hypothetical protein